MLFRSLGQKKPSRAAAIWSALVISEELKEEERERGLHIEETSMSNLAK